MQPPLPTNQDNNKREQLYESLDVANMEIDVIIDFDLDGSNDCNDVFYPSAVIDSGEFGAWTKEEACTYTLGGQYLHKTRVKVTSL